jgi:hypothetical protein
MRSGLEVHHIRERGDGGTDEIDNLRTLCGDCHCEWTFCQPLGLAFDVWALLLPARFLIPAFACAWPDNESAAAFKERLTTELSAVIDACNAESSRDGAR